jgi:DNA polymerase (family 10)
MKNKTVAEILYKIADLLDLKGEIFFKTRAYRIAAQQIEVMEENIETVVQEHRLTSISGIGEALAKKITELVTTGKLDYFERLQKEVPVGLLVLLEIPSLGPKKIAALYKNLGITSLEELKDACERGKLRDLEGFGEITERNILRGIQLMQKTSGRVLIHVAYDDGKRYLDYLTKCDKIKHLSLAGSLRRMKETIGDIDILASSDSPDEVMNYFVKYPDVQRVLLQGNTKTSVLLNDNLQVDLRVILDKSFGSALQYFTGAKEHNVTLRSLAIKQGFKLNEYGLFKKDTDSYVAGAREKDIYKTLGLQYIEPELRENRGEIDAAQRHELPKIIQDENIHGDFHVHSIWSDGSNSVEEIAYAAQQRKYKFICITDHSQSLKIAHGLSEERVKKKIRHIKKINEKFLDLKIFCGTECDIKPDGSLDYSNQILQLFDVVYIGIHVGFKLSKEDMTKRIIRGMDNEFVHALAHPTGRLIGRREPYEIDFEQIIDAAKETDTFLEINAFPDRLDLNDQNVKFAKDRGVQFVIGTDSHTIKHLPYMRFGTATARRGWLTKEDVLNTYPLDKLEKRLGANS